MVVKSSGRKVYRTANGKTIDLDSLISRNELTPAVGNARVNARGDELGPGGKIVRKREDIVKDYYDKNIGVPDEKIRTSHQAKSTPKKDLSDTDVASDKPSPKQSRKPNKAIDDEWAEDQDGNFVKKGE